MDSLTFFWVFFGYLAGAVPFGLVLTRLAGLGDIRDIGSGNIGATNVLRTGNKPLALATFILDASKGGIMVVAAQQFVTVEIAYIVGIVAFLGHIYPVWTGFKGGKGVAIYWGILLGFYPLSAGIFAAIWLVSVALFRISSLSAFIACTITPVILYFLGMSELALVTGTLSALVFWGHRANIGRLIKRTEPKIEQK